jgi:hypothetical protein
MPDWRRYVRERLSPLGLRHEREEDVLAELADHLEDQYAAEGEKDLSPPGQLVGMDDGTDWILLARAIRDAEDTMSPNGKTLLVPGLSMLFCSFALLLAMTRLVPPATWVDPKAPLLLLTPWLLSYTLFGALGALWSRRAGGTTAARFFSGTFPLALHLAVFVLPILVALASDASRFPEHLQPNFLLRTALLWVVIPGAALSIGALPFLHDNPHG